MKLATIEGTGMSLFRRAFEPGVVGNPRAPFLQGGSFLEMKHFWATFHHVWHIHGKFEIMLILLGENPFQSSNLIFKK